MSKPADQILRDLGLVFRNIIGVGLYLWGVISGLIYLFNHALIKSSTSGYSCSNSAPNFVTKHTQFIKCDPMWYQGNAIHWGLVLGIIGVVVLTILLLVAMFGED